MLLGRRGLGIAVALLSLSFSSAAAGAPSERYGLACAVEVPTIDWLRPTVNRCETQSHEGAVPIAWVLHPDEPDPGRNSTTVVVAVQEGACASGRNPIPFLDKPEVDYLKRAVVIRLWIHPPEGVNTCQGNPIGRLEVDLPGPLGKRRLYDGASDPPRRVKPGEDLRDLRAEGGRS
jgi:hypothetical protein